MCQPNTTDKSIFKCKITLWERPVLEKLLYKYYLDKI